MGLRIAALLLASFAALPLYAGQCAAESGPGTAALVELYTSEGCSRCPPAERWLSALAGQAAGGALVALALHVDYAHYIGSPRQRKLSPLQRMALVYTPQVVLQGRDFRQWASRAFDEAVARINAQPARAHLRLAILGAGEEALYVETRAVLATPMEDAALYVAAYRSGPRHAYLVLEWQGPFGVGAELSQRRRLPFLPGASAAESGVAAFVQDRRTGEVLQALLRSAC